MEPANTYVRLLAEHEEAIAVLYEFFRDIFSHEAQFWQDLVLDERTHANVLRQIHEKIENGTCRFKQPEYNISDISSSIESLETAMRDFRERGVDMTTALEFASTLEHSILEKRFFHVIETDSSEARQDFDSLIRTTAEHRNTVKQKLAEHQS